MKNLYTFLLFVGIIGIACSSCKKDKDDPNYNALSGNKISGKIADWNHGSDKQIFAYASLPYDKVGTANIGADGSFTLTLNTPAISSLESISSYFDSELIYSDLTAECTDLSFYVADASSNYYGYLERASNVDFTYQVGYASVDYIYSTKGSTVKGVLHFSSTGQTGTGSFDLALSQGWSTFSRQVTKYDITTSAAVMEYKASNTEPSNVKWLFTTSKKKGSPKSF
jgi:hypothetical protein